MGVDIRHLRISPNTTLDLRDDSKIPNTSIGAAGGVAQLDSAGKVPASQLPSYVDDVVEYSSLESFPVTGESGKIYVALDTGFEYRWGGTQYTRLNTYDLATQSNSGLMSSSDKIKLDNVGKYDFNPKIMEEAILAVENCSHAKVIVNRGDTAILDGAVPAGSILALALNGNANSVATAIKSTNTSGLATAGTVERTIDGTVIKFSRPVLKTVQVNYDIRSEVSVDATALQTAIETAVGTYFQSLHIGEELDPEKLRQVAMEQLGTTAAPFTVVSDIYVLGAHGVSRETLVPAYNEKFILSNYAPVFLTIVRVPRFTVVNGQVCITYQKEAN